jgi:battenin
MDEPLLLPSVDSQPKSSLRTLIAFWLMGLANNFGYVVMLSAAGDLLQHTSLSPPVVLLANILPGFIVQLLCPWVQDRVPWKLRMGVCCALGVASFLLAALFDDAIVRIVGVALGSMGSSFGEMTCLAYSGGFHKNTVSAWSSGTGAAGLAGALFYWLATSPIGASYTTTLLAFCWIPAAEGVLFLFMVDPRDRRTAAEAAPVAEPIVDESRATPLNSRSDLDTLYASTLSDSVTQRSASARSYSKSIYDHKSDGVHSAPPSIINYDDVSPLLQPRASATAAEDEPLTFGTRARLLVRLAPFMLPLALVYFAEYLINQSVYATVFYRDAALISCASQYTFLQLCYQVGVLISRSSVNLVRLRTICALQLPALFQVINLVVLALNSVYLFLPSLWLVVAFGVWEGVMGGSIYVNVFYMVSERFKGREKEFCLGSTTQAYGLSITAAAVAGLFFEPFLLAHAKVQGCAVPMGNSTTTTIMMMGQTNMTASG